MLLSPLNRRATPDLAIVLLATGTMVALLTFGRLIAQRLETSKTQWQAYNHRVHAISEGMASLQRHAGYGGFIHYQAMLLERNPAKYQPLIEQDLTLLQQDFNRLQAALILPENQQRLETVRNTFAQHEQQYRAALQMLADSRSTTDIVAATAMNEIASVDALQQMLTRANELTLSAERRVQQSLDHALAFLKLGVVMSLVFLLVATVLQLRRLRHLWLANQAIRRQTRALRQAKDKAEAGERAKSAVLAAVTHQFRTPMHSIIGFAQLLESDPKLNADQLDSLQEILAASAQMMDLIQQVLSAAQAGHTLPELGTTRAPDLPPPSRTEPNQEPVNAQSNTISARRS